MAIRIFSAGKEIGPYSEPQVRQYLGEGLVAPTDLAAHETSTEWERLDQLLGRLAAASSPSDRGEGQAGAPQAITVRATTLQRSKRGPISLQAIGTGASAKRPRTGKTAVSIEPPRPTTQLPEVAKFAPREYERPPRRPLAGDVALSPESFYEKFGPGVAIPASAPAPVPPAMPAEPAPPQPTAILPESESPSQPIADLEGAGSLPPVILYVGLTLGLLVVALVAAVVYLILHLNSPAPRDLSSSAENLPGAAATPENPQTSADYVARGLARQSNGALDTALADFDRAVQLDSHNAEAYYRRGVARQTKGDWNGALADYNSLLALEPANADGYCNRGFIKQTLGDPDGALADYAEALAHNPKIAVAYFNIGLIKTQRRDLDGGIEAYNRAIDLDPKITRAFYNRGNAKTTEGDLDGAIADYTQALALDPKIALAYFARGFARQSRGDSNGALADYSQAISLDSQLAAAYYRRGEIKLQRGDFAGTVADSAWAIELDPKNAAASNNRGLARLGQGNLDGAGADLRRYCELAPRENGSDAARLFLWIITAEQNHQDDADRQLQSALQNDWNSSPEDFTSKIAAYLLGHIRENELLAAAVSPDVSRQPAQACKAWYFVGMKHTMAGDNVNALADFQKSVATGQDGLCEYLFSKAEARSLGQSRQASARPAPAVTP